MILLFIAFIVLAATFVASKMMKSDEIKFYMLPFRIGEVVAALLVILSCVAVVPTGYTGILTTFGRVEDKTINAGLNFIAPWQTVVRMDNRTQKVDLETSAFSSDIQQVDLAVTINYRIDQSTAQNLYRTVGKEYYDGIIFPRILENTKAVIAEYSAENLIAKREILSAQIAEAMSKDMNTYGIVVVSVSIEDIDFTDAFTNAVEAKQVATQNKLTAETEQAKKTMEEKAAAERRIVNANAELEAAKIKADADLYVSEKEAEANEKIAKSLNENLIQYYRIRQWDGKLPETILGSDSNYIFSPAS